VKSGAQEIKGSAIAEAGVSFRPGVVYEVQGKDDIRASSRRKVIGDERQLRAVSRMVLKRNLSCGAIASSSGVK